MASAASVLAPIGEKSIVDEVVRRLESAIFNCTLHPGQPLKELGLARSLNVSQTTIRSSLGRLENWGLVARDTDDWRGSSVINFSRAELKQRVALRTELEKMAFLRFALKYQEAGRSEQGRLELGLEERLEKMRRAGNDKAGKADLAFHAYVWDECDYTYLSGLLKRETKPLFALVRLLLEAGLKDGHQVPCHEKLRDVLLEVEKNIEKMESSIERALEEHMDRAYGGFFKSRYEDFRAVALILQARRTLAQGPATGGERKEPPVVTGESTEVAVAASR